MAGNGDGDGGVLVVFDFDWSLVEANSDRFLLSTLCPVLLHKLKARRGRMPWTKLLTELLDELMTQTSDVTRELIERTVADIPVQERMIDALLLAANQSDSVVAVVSQANTVFIECMLARHELRPLVHKVVSNPATWTTDSMQQQRLIVQPFHPADQAPHGCRLCPVNMCKGVVLDQLRRERKPHRIVYVGDGTVDFCPVLRLRARDVVLARAGSHDGRPFALLPMLQVEPDRIKASVVPWRTGHDVFAQFVKIFDSYTL